MYIPLDHDSPEPLYRQVRRGLQRAISTGDFGVRRLPSSRELAASLGISRNTVNLAYQELVADGYVSAQPRSGMVVNPELADRLARPEPGPESGRESGPDPSPPHRPRPQWLGDLAARPPLDTLPHISKTADWQRYRYRFATGHVPLEAFPTAAWLRCLRTALGGEHRAASLQDSQDADDPLLLEALCRDVLPARGIAADPARVLVTNGSQQGMHLITTALIGPGARVAVEDPGYPDARHILARAGARLVGLPVDRGGVVVEPWPDDIAMALVTPSHQYPTNATLSAPRRARLLELAAAGGFPVVEDDYDGELRYVGRSTPALAASDPASVVYLGSFAKFLAPGLRLGYVVAEPELIAYLRDLRRYMVRHPSGHLQRALALLIASGEYRRWVRTLRTLLRERWLAAGQAVDRHLPTWQYDPAAGGVSLWLRAPDGLDTRLLAGRAAAAGVLIETGETCFLDGDQPACTVRLGFASIRTADIEPGIAALAAEARALLGGR
ncbi:MocR-like pyridoxine biosynthesis transcription factor PdxR [Yinghuangia soli]|uniref:PLP-dependent aminotransferase family protein n=1 Tax=Yinghuangia soli TaxID=2908204 RepID=A0AA41PYG3_9ACTN|nr:PLP-dependent aminotransferase family protein [Yinghuangia soli]MCF2527139.1 PLP-dependent aminotransferase family protein [Yinghuangia soli]